MCKTDHNRSRKESKLELFNNIRRAKSGASLQNANLLSDSEELSCPNRVPVIEFLSLMMIPSSQVPWQQYCPFTATTRHPTRRLWRLCRRLALRLRISSSPMS